MDTIFHVEQFEDKALSHYSYAIISKDKMVLVDPARNTEPYYEYAKKHDATIVAIIETHPHADFVSSHLEIHKYTGAVILVSSLVNAKYPNCGFDDGDIFVLGDVKLKAINTPGHSPDSICVILEADGLDKAIFTGDTLFVGDCGRSDLRASVGNMQENKEILARKMYHTLRKKLSPLNDNVIVYPTHGAGSLCGKSLTHKPQSTIGDEKKTNWCLQTYTEQEFVNILINEQAFVPRYFKYNVILNINGTDNLQDSIKKIPYLGNMQFSDYLKQLDKSTIIVDMRPKNIFQQGYLPNSINLPVSNKFETWLGSIIDYETPFYLLANTEQNLNELLKRIGKIGYENQITATLTLDSTPNKFDILDINNFTQQKQNYTIIDLRNESEYKEKQIFENAINIPLPELRERLNEIPTHKPIVTHCAGGYRSAVGSSIIKNNFADSQVFDLGEAVLNF